MAQPSARLYVNSVGWVVGVEVFSDGEWQDALYEHVNINNDIEGVVVAPVGNDDYEGYRMEREGIL